VDKLEKQFLIRIIQIWMRKIEIRFSENWAQTEAEKAHYRGRHRAYKEILEVLTGETVVGFPVPETTAKKDKK